MAKPSNNTVTLDFVKEVIAGRAKMPKAACYAEYTCPTCGGTKSCALGFLTADFVSNPVCAGCSFREAWQRSKVAGEAVTL